MAVFWVVFMTSMYIPHAILAQCPRGWQSWRDACYAPVYERLNWTDAAKICQRPGSNLFVTNSPEEREFIVDMRTTWFGVDLGAGYHGLWIGCESLNKALECLGQNDEEEVASSWQGKALSDVRRRWIFIGGVGIMRTGDCGKPRLVVCEMQSSKNRDQAYCVSLGADGRVGPAVSARP